MLNVLVACFDNWNTLAEIPFVLKRGGCRVTVLCDKNAWLKSNSFYDEWIPSRTGEDAYVQHLVELAKSEKYNWIILGDEPLIKLMNGGVQDPELFSRILPVKNIQHRAILSSKVGLAEVCKNCNITAPASWGYDDKGQLDYDAVVYPVIIKKDFGWGGVGISICQNRSELEEQLVKVPQGETQIIQQYIDGPEVPVEALFYEGKLLNYTVSQILSYDKDQFTYSTRRKYIQNETVRPELEKLGREVGIHGFANVAYMYSNHDNKHYLIEVDIRPNSWVPYSRFLNSSFSDAIGTLNGKPRKSQPPSASVEISIFYKDIRRCIYKRDYKGIARWMFNPTYWRYIPFYDRKLLARTFKELWKEFPVGKVKSVLGRNGMK
jgi:hypothetical protein